MRVRNVYRIEELDGTALGESTGTAAVVSENADSGVNWDKLDNEFDRLQNHSDETPFEADPAPVAPKVVEPPVEPSAPVVPPVPTPSEIPPVAPEAPAAPAVTPEAPATPPVDRAAQRQQYMTQLQTDYAISDEDAQMMLTEPEKVLPKIAAQLHVNVVDTVIAAVMNNLPRAINAIQAQAQVSSESENEFFKAWPQLKKAEYQATVYDAVAAYRALRPQAPRDEVMRAAGLQAMIALRLPIPPELLTQAPAATAPASFTPAAPGSGAAPQAPSGEGNPFVQLSQEFLLDD